MEQMNFHKQKLYALIVAGAALIALLLPWAKASYQGITYGSQNGLKGEGLITLLGVVAVIVACFMGDKAKSFEGNFKNIALGGFAAILAGAVIVFISLGGKGAVGVKAGIGLWL